MLQGKPFREAYIEVGKEVEAKTYSAAKGVHHTHAGSIGNLCTEQIRGKMAAAAKVIR